MAKIITKYKKSVTVKLNQGMAGHVTDSEGKPRHAFSKNSGDIVELPEDEAERYIERGYASPVESK